MKEMKSKYTNEEAVPRMWGSAIHKAALAGRKMVGSARVNTKERHRRGGIAQENEDGGPSTMRAYWDIL